VTNGAIGCIARTNAFSTNERTAARVASCPGAFVASTYQSQNVYQPNCKSASAATPNWKPSYARVTVSTQARSSVRIHLSARVNCSRGGSTVARGSSSGSAAV